MNLLSTRQTILGKEWGTVRKDWGGRLPIALTFPNSYYLGMSSLALHSLYRLWNAREDVVCERVFLTLSPTNLRQPNLPPPASLESGSPLGYFPVVAFSLSYEMDYFNVVRLLRAADIPVLASDRDQWHPLIMAGGPAVSANPEPLAPLLDAVAVGEVEPNLDAMTDALQLLVNSRDEALLALSQIPGLYLPHLGGDAVAPETVTRQYLRDLDACPTHSVILTPETEFADMGLIEIARGCGRGCRFCLAGFAYRPARQRSVESILDQAGTLLRHTERIGLVSAAVSDHRQIDQLALELRKLGARISISSMRVDPLSEPLIQVLADSGIRTLTIAPEAGSARLRTVINKSQTEDDVLRAVELAAQYGFEQIKLYFMIGLPTETEQDVEALINLVLACAERFPRQTTANLTPFVPKAHTPFQRLAQAPSRLVGQRITRIEKKLRKHRIVVRSESPTWAEVQGSLARGDRRVCQALLALETMNPRSWQKALSGAGLSLEAILGPRGGDEMLPWAHIRGPVSSEFLEREAARSRALTAPH